MALSLKLRTFLLVVFTLLTCWQVRGQNITFYHLTADQGMSDNRINCALQDYRGFLWFGANPGLNRYDGTNIVVYGPTENDSVNLANQFICALYEDRDSLLWAISDSGLFRYNRMLDVFAHIAVLYAHGEDTRFMQVGSITEDEDGNIWFGNQFGGIYRFSKGSETLRFYPEPTQSISCLYTDRSGHLWAGTFGSEIYLFDKTLDRYRLYHKFSANIEDIPENYIWNIFENPEGKMIVGTSYGIYSLDPESGKISNLPFLPETLSSFRNNEIRYVYEESPEKIWIGTWGKGLYRYDPLTGRTENFQVEPWRTYSLSNNDVNFIFKDRSGVLWIGTQDGLNILDPAKSLFRKYQNNPNDPASLHFNFITSFCEDRQGMIWVGTYGNGISIFNPVTETFTLLRRDSHSSNTLVNNAIRAICEDPSGHMWIGTMKGLDRFDPRTGRFQPYPFRSSDSAAVSSNDILCVINGTQNDLWVGTYGGGIERVYLPSRPGETIRSVNYHHHPDDPNSLSSNYIRSLCLDASGKLWIGTLGGGVSRMDPETGNFTRLEQMATKQSRQVNTYINCIKEVSSGDIWIGTWEGIVVFHPESGGIIRYTVEEGLPDNNISEIQEDDSGNIWVSTFKGIVKFDLNEQRGRLFTGYNKGNGLQGSKFNVNASLKASDGSLYFGGTTGFNIIYPDQVRANTLPPSVVLTSLRIFNEPVYPGERINGRIILEKTISESERITLTHRDRIVSIEFAALFFSETDKLTYRYFLEGIDMDWVTVDSKRSFATYSNLKKGDYLFRVQAANSDGIWNEAGASLNIKVLPPAWNTWWAIIIYALIVSLLLLLGRNYSVARANLKNELKYEQIEREKANELNQMKLRFFTNISHEFRTPLTLIVGPLEKLAEMIDLPGKAKDHIHVINKNARRLLHLLNQLMDFRKIDTGNTKLKAAESDVVSFVEEIKSAFNDFAREHRIRYEMISDMDQQLLWFDRDKLEIVLYNLLSNAFKFTSDRGKVSIQIDIRNETKNRKIIKRRSGKYSRSEKAEIMDRPHLRISVEDNGIGIPRERINKIFDRFYQVESTHALRQTLKDTGTGIGLSISKEFIELHRGMITVESELGRGTVFSVFLPLGSEHLDESEKSTAPPDSVSEGTSIDAVLLADGPENDYLEKERSLLQEHSASGTKILVVEDNDDIRKFIISCFESDFSVYETDNAIEGFDIAIQEVPDLIISDIRMPVMDGHEFCSKIKSDVRTSHIPVILLTAYNTEENQIQGYETGADAYITKPFNARLLNARIRNLIEIRRQLKKIFGSELDINPKRFTLNTLDEKFIKNAISIVEESMADPDFSVVSLGRNLGMSRTNLFRKMKALTDQSASEFIRTIRMKKAAQALLSGYNVSQAMYEVGINSRSYFNKCFYQHFKMTPSEFIKEHTY